MIVHRFSCPSFVRKETSLGKGRNFSGIMSCFRSVSFALNNKIPQLFGKYAVQEHVTGGPIPSEVLADLAACDGTYAAAIATIDPTRIMVEYAEEQAV